MAAGLMDLFIKIGVEDEASGKIANITKSVGGGLVKAAAIGAKAVGIAVGAVATGIGKITVDAAKAYANYEQLVGGVETLFGAGGRTLEEFAEKTGLVGDEALKAYGDLMTAQDAVMNNASNAYRTAGLSANQYMETVTSFSAALIAGLDGDTKEAARISDMAITDMADNANKMGTDMSAIQSAYQGFAKQNYTMLDNLKLGYGGTKTEMERLLADAQKFSGVKYDINNLADVYEAIHVIQTEMDITGTTAREAATTIQGSWGMLSGAWQNLIAGLGDPNADLDKLFGDVIDAGETFLDNLMPVIEKALVGIGQVVEKAGPMIAEKLPELIPQIVPGLLSAAVSIVGSLIAALPSLIDTIVEAIPEMMQEVWEAVDTAISNSGFAETWAVIKESVSTAVAGIKENWDSLAAALQPLIDRVQAAWQGFIKWAQESGILQVAIEGIAAVINTVIAVIGGIAVAFDSALTAAGQAANWIKEKWQPVADFFSRIAATIEGIFAKGPGVGVGMENIDWSGMNFAIGTDYVPYNGMPAVLHKGEAVLTAREAEEWRQGESGSGKVVNLNIYAQQLTQADMDYIVATVNRELAP